MGPIRTRQELLVHLAKRGDAAAFYSLAAAGARSAYVSLRNAGKDHGEAVALLAPFLRRLHAAFMRRPKDIPFDAWYGAVQRKHLPSEAFVLEGAGGATKGAIPDDEISRFESQMMLVLQKNSSTSLRGGSPSPLRGGLSFVSSHRLLKTAIAAAVFLIAVCAVLYAWLTFAKADLTISVTTARASSRLELPLAVNRVLFGARAIRNYPEARTGNPKNPATAADSGRTALPQRSFVPDGVPKSLPPVRNLSLPARTPNTGGRATKRKSLPAARTPQPDSLTSSLPRNQMSVPGSEPVRSSSSQDKSAASPPQQGTQPSATLDSSTTPP
jgi:hypothetical protein